MSDKTRQESTLSLNNPWSESEHKTHSTGDVENGHKTDK